MTRLDRGSWFSPLVVGVSLIGAALCVAAALYVHGVKP